MLRRVLSRRVSVEAMIEFVRRGPGHATVSSVDVTEEEPQGLTRFGTG